MKKLSLIATFCLLIVITKAQNYDITGVKRFNPLSIQAIVEQNEVKGYYSFMKIDKASKKEDIYSLAILDNNLKQTYSVELKKSDKLTLLETTYNGQGFCFSFVDSRNKTLEYMMLDKTGKTAGSYTMEISGNELGIYQAALADEDGYFTGGLLTVKNKGFLRVGYEKKKGYRYELELIDNSGKVKWSKNSGASEDEKIYESAQGFYANDKYIVVSTSSRGKKINTKGMESNFLFLDAETGKELFKLLIQDKTKSKETSYLQYYGMDFDEGAGSFIGYGQYFAEGDDPTKDDSKGMFIQEIGLDGKIKSETYTTWAGEINNILLKKVKDQLKDDLKKNMKTFIQKVVKTADGKYFAIAEQYRKAVSGMGVASNIANGLLGGGPSGVSVAKIELHNMLVFEFDNGLKIKDVHLIEKEKTNIQLPSGIGMADANALGYLMKMWGNYDYCYTSVSSDRKQFNATYANYDRDKSAGSKYTIGNVSYTKEQKVSVDRIKLTSNPTFFRIIPAKPGYVAIFEYFKKQKKVTLRFEKLNT